MTRYADPFACPDCHATLPLGAVRCPSCDLLLQHPLATELLRTLAHADSLLGRLRAVVPASTAPVPSSSPLAAAAPGPVGDPRFPDVPVPSLPAGAPRRTGVTSASVPKILLGLGATCLLVAAVIFLAVAWSWLGVGGRTTVLVALTVATGGAGTWLAGRGLRVAGESLTVVALGLLALDVIGADNAGWLGHLSDAGLTTVVGAVLGAVALALALAPQRLVTPQLVAPAALGLAALGTTGLGSRDLAVAAVAVLAFAGLAALGRRTRLTVLPWVSLVGAVVSWLVLTATAFGELRDPLTFTTLWLSPGWALVLASAYLLLPVLFADPSETSRRVSGETAKFVTGQRDSVLTLATAAALSLLTITLALPALDESSTVASAVALGVLVAWTAVSLLLPQRWSVVARVPASLAAIPVSGVVLALLAQAGERVLLVDGRGADARLSDGADLVHPALLVPSALALVALTVAWLPRGRAVPWLAVLAPTAAVTGTATLALFPVPLWTVVVTITAVGAALVADALRRTTSTGVAEAALGGLVLLAALLAGAPSEVLVTGVLAVLVLASTAVLWSGRFPGADALGGASLPLALAALLWSVAGLADVVPVDRAVPVLLVVGLLAIARPRVETEATAGLAGLVAGAVAVGSAVDTATALALHLTVAGALVTVTSLVHVSRRPLAWLGGLLLAMATWVRLADLGVDAPEAYTLPTAAALLLVGLHRLRATGDASSASSLAPGLALATVPSLLWVLAGDPVSLRAGLLGAGCLALVLAGVRLRWSAPLVTGAIAGAVLVLRELAPYAAQTPQWVVIGAAGTLLTLVGVTWERRVVDLRHASAYLERLR